VQNNAYGEALTRLEKHGVVIISGLPGVGKTTLADLLLYDHMAKGFQPVAIRNGFDEARTLYKEGVSQIFHYDDFIGATFLGDRAAGFTKNEDRAILDFVNLIRDSKDSRMILTTREHILQQAINTSERLEHARVVDHRFVLTLQHYSKEQRAKILYNHVYFSDLPPAFIKALLADDFFMTILDHEKFTPRLVEWLSDYRRVGKETSAADYPKFVERLLANPAEIWRHAYRQQISDAARSFLLGLYSMNGRTGVTPLRRAFDPLHTHRSKRYQFLTTPHDFSTALKELNGGFISISGGLVEFINPSVIDFINDELRHAPENAVDIVQGASRFEQAGHVFRVARAQSGGASLIAALWQNDTQIAEALERLLAVPRKTQFANGAVGFGDTTREARLNQIVRLANEHRSPLIAKLIPTAFEYLRKHVAEEEVHVEDAIDIVRTFKTADWDGVTMHGSIADELLAMVLEDAREGCSAYDLNEILSQIPQPTAEQLSTLRQAYARFEKDWFQDDLKNCADGGEYASLDQSLDAFASRLGVDVREPKSRVEAAMDHYAEQEERRADDMYDSWKDQKYDREFEDAALRHMFDSLRKSGD
jgi:hypothetical protein